MVYITIEELAEYLHLSPDYISSQIQLGNIRAVSDGQQYLINKQQFVNTKGLIEKQFQQWRENQLEPIPEDIDVKDED